MKFRAGKRAAGPRRRRRVPRTQALFMRWALACQGLLGVVAAAILNSDFPSLHPALAIIPAMLAILLRIEFPPPGKGVGKLAPPLPAKISCLLGSKPPPLAEKNLPLAGHGYVLVFWRNTSSCLKALKQVERVWLKCSESHLPLHFILVCRDDREIVEEQAKAFSKSQRAGRRMVSIVHDADMQFTRSFLMAFSAVVLPHAFVIGSDGKIIWHGQTSRKPFVVAVGQVLAILDKKND